MAGTLGAQNLQQAAHDLELSIDKNQTDDILVDTPADFNELTDTFTDALTTVCHSIEHMEKEWQADDSNKKDIIEPANLSVEQIMLLLEELKQLIENDDFAAIRVFEQLPEAHDHIDNAALQKLDESLEAYDFETALVELTQVMQMLEKAN